MKTGKSSKQSKSCKQLSKEQVETLAYAIIEMSKPSMNRGVRERNAVIPAPDCIEMVF